MVEREDACAMRLKRAVRKMTGDSPPEALLVAANPQLARHCAEYLLAWEEEFRCRILLREDQSLQWGRSRWSTRGPEAGGAPDEERRGRNLGCT